MPSFPSFSPAGDSAILITLGEQIAPETNRRVHALASALEGQGLTCVPGYAALLAHYDPLALDYPAALERIQRAAQQAAQQPLPEPRRVEVPVFYGGEHGPDLPFVAQHCGLSEAEVVRLHAAGEYPVYFIGFTPGFPYLGGMDTRLAAPRLEAPRPLVRAGSVGIAGPQTGIYSVDSPGGWRIIGWTPLRLFDPSANPPALFQPGDVVRFIAQI